MRAKSCCAAAFSTSIKMPFMFRAGTFRLMFQRVLYLSIVIFRCRIPGHTGSQDWWSIIRPPPPLGSLKFEELSDDDISHTVQRRFHSLAFTGSKWVVFADPPPQQTGWLIDFKISSLFVVTGKKHKLRKVVNSGTRLCSYHTSPRRKLLWSKRHKVDQATC